MSIRPQPGLSEQQQRAILTLIIRKLKRNVKHMFPGLTSKSEFHPLGPKRKTRRCVIISNTGALRVSQKNLTQVLLPDGKTTLYDTNKQTEKLRKISFKLQPVHFLTHHDKKLSETDAQESYKRRKQNDK